MDNIMDRLARSFARRNVIDRKPQGAKALFKPPFHGHILHAIGTKTGVRPYP
jgi:hypothetical protein